MSFMPNQNPMGQNSGMMGQNGGMFGQQGGNSLRNTLMAGLGGVGMGAMAGSGFGGSSPSMKKFDTMNPEQQGILQQLLQQLSPQGNLGQGYQEGISGMRDFMDPSSEAYQRFEQPYMDQFNQQTVPGLAERFAGFGGQSGALSSSGFGQSLSAAGGNLQNQLASMKTGLMQKAMGDIMNQYGNQMNTGLGAQSFGYQNRPGQLGFMEQAAGGLSKGIPSLMSLLF